MSERPPVAVVTGAASGIGRAMAVRLNGLGYRLVLIDQDHAGLLALETSLPHTGGHDHELVAADVSSAEAWHGLAETLAHDHADVALLVQAAGVLLAGPLIDCRPEDLDRLVRANLTGVLLGAAAIGPLLAKNARNGQNSPLPRGVLNVASVFASVAPPGFAAYNASKAGVVAATETLRGEWTRHGLTATAVLPGITPTGLFDAATYTDERYRTAANGRVASAAMSAEEVADASLEAYRRGRLVAPIGGRARRYHWLKRWFPGPLLKRVADQAGRELPQ